MCDIDAELRSLDETPEWDFLKQAKHGSILARHVQEMTHEQSAKYRTLLNGYRNRINARMGYAYMGDAK